MMEQSCDSLHVFGGHGFNLLGGGRTLCSWVPTVVAHCLKKAIVKTPALGGARALGQPGFLPDAAAIKRMKLICYILHTL